MGLNCFKVMAKCGTAVLAILFLSSPFVWANENANSGVSGFPGSYSEEQLRSDQQLQGKEETSFDSWSFSDNNHGKIMTVAQGGDHGGGGESLPALIPLGQAEVQQGDRFFGEKFEERILNMGADSDFTLLERNLFKAQVKTFIPPLLVPAIAGHAFVLPPGLMQLAVNFKFVNLSGDDFNVDGHDNPIHSQNGVRRQFLTLSLFYGFDLNMKYLHSFTAVLNIPWQNAQNTGPILLPNVGGKLGSVRVFNGGDSQGLGDVSLFIKKKLLDQANENRFFGIPIPVNLAVAGGIFFPTGSNTARAGQEGRIPINPSKGPFGGCPTGVAPPASVGCPNPVFGRFSDDGRLPTGLQPGNGDFAFQLAGFLTRQLVPGDMPDFLAGTSLDRGVIHAGGFAKFSRSADGISRGNKYVGFFTAAVPLYKDYLAFQVHNINIVQNRDTYRGVFLPPHKIGLVPVKPKRGVFRGGWTSLLGSSLVFSPDPLVRMFATAMFRIKEPELGPSPPYVIKIGTSYIF